MTRSADLRIQPAEVAGAATQLDELASRAEKLMRAEVPNLTVTAPAGDEVSQRVGSTLNEVHAEFSRSTDHGTSQIREIAATLRAHTQNVLDAEQDFAV